MTALSDVHHDDVPTGEGHVRLSRDRGQGESGLWTVVGVLHTAVAERVGILVLYAKV